jgi:hypothetical protein
MKRIRILAVILALILGSWLVRLYFVSDHAGAIVFQKNDEAYLFLGDGHTGWHFPALFFPVVLAGEYLHVPTNSSDEYGQSLVIRVTPEGVQRWVNRSSHIANLTPFEDDFYARCPGTVLCRWTERGFVRASPEDEKRIGVDKLYTGSFDNKIVNGWTTHQLKFAAGDNFEVQLGHDLAISVKNRSERDAFPNVAVDLLRPGQAPENLYRADGEPRRVSRSEYEQLFGRH